MTNLPDDSVAKLITFLKEKPRATRKGNRDYIDTGNNLELIQVLRHTVVFGRRGSGKTMLLSELEEQSKETDRGLIWIDIDDYKALAFPDILIQILRSLFSSLSTQIIKSNPWYRPLKRLAVRPILSRLRNEEKYLKEMLQRFEEASSQIQQRDEQKHSSKRDSALKTSKGAEAGLSESNSRETLQSRTEHLSGTDRKIDHISRHLHDAKALLRDATDQCIGIYYLVLDDFYHLPITDQSQVLDYLQSMTKNLEVYIKFGTIAHRSSLYRRGSELIHGMQKEHDVLPIDLDRTFQNFPEVEKFIHQFWNQIKLINDSADFDQLFAGESWRQLILSSGGVPRDFMNILARALEIGRSKMKTKLDVFLINEAANLYLRETKHDDLISDQAEETDEIEQMLVDIRNFCVEERKRNIFLVDKDDLEHKPHQFEVLRQLLDYRLVHLVHSNTSSAGRPGRYSAFMLDVGLYAHPQRRGINRVTEVDFHSRNDQHRADAIRIQPVYTIKDSYSDISDSPFDEPDVTDAEVDADPSELSSTDSNQLTDKDEAGQKFLPFS